MKMVVKQTGLVEQVESAEQYDRFVTCSRIAAQLASHTGLVVTVCMIDAWTKDHAHIELTLETSVGFKVGMVGYTRNYVGNNTWRPGQMFTFNLNDLPICLDAPSVSTLNNL